MLQSHSSEISMANTLADTSAFAAVTKPDQFLHCDSCSATSRGFPDIAAQARIVLDGGVSRRYELRNTCSSDPPRLPGCMASAKVASMTSRLARIQMRHPWILRCRWMGSCSFRQTGVPPFSILADSGLNRSQVSGPLTLPSRRRRHSSSRSSSPTHARHFLHRHAAHAQVFFPSHLKLGQNIGGRNIAAPPLARASSRRRLTSLFKTFDKITLFLLSLFPSRL
jgi:hypothetical protein